MTMKRLLVPLLVLMMILAGCAEDSSAENNAEDVKAYVAELSGSNEVEAASIDHEKLYVEDAGVETVHELPEDEFFVSFAPYLTTTHPCAVHSLSGCQGEMADEDIDVKIYDEDGEVHVDEAMTTMENGFVDLWLPRDKEYTLTIEYEGKSIESEFSTFEGDNTCLTELPLK